MHTAKLQSEASRLGSQPKGGHMAYFALVDDYAHKLADLVTKINEELNYCDWRNGHSVDRYGARILRITVCHTEVSALGEPVVLIHTYGSADGDLELKFSITKVSDNEVILDFFIGELTDVSIRLLTTEVLKLYRKARASGNKKRREAKMAPEDRPSGGLNPEMSGLYVWRGSLGKRSKCWKNFEEAIRSKFASPELVESMKHWSLHFRSF